MDVAAYVVGGLGGLILAFAGLFGFKKKSITVILFVVGATFVIVGFWLYWQDVRKKHQRLKAGRYPNCRKLAVVGSGEHARM
jgi:hypothetical protein